VKGHIRERSPGRWAIILDARDSATGQRKRRWHSFQGTKRQAQIECARLISEIQRGASVDPTRETLAEFLERWLEHMRGQVSPRSHERYAELARKNIIPLLGALTLTQLQPVHISKAYSKALADGRRDGQGGLSPRTVHHMHRVLRQAMQQAVAWQLLLRNPADMVKPPRVERRQMATLNADATIECIEAARGTSMFIPILLGLLCGLRRGEITALRWRAINFETAQLAVVASTEQTDEGVREKETKSGKGRSVALSAMVVAELRTHRAKQAEALLMLGVRLSDNHHVVCREDGAPLQPRSLSQAFRKFIRKHDLQRIRLHDLRHSAATHMLAAGVHPKIAQERLGHSSVAVTIDLYSHVLPGMQADAVSRVDAVLADALNRRDHKAKG
jgi:integrase